jgi:hypothetical protein
MSTKYRPLPEVKKKGISTTIHNPACVNPESRGRSHRRMFLQQSSLALAAIGSGAALAPQAGAQSPAPAAGLGGSRDSRLFPVVETNSGKVQGISNTSIKEFYGASTAGKNRYMPPRKPASWGGLRECFGHGQKRAVMVFSHGVGFATGRETLPGLTARNWPDSAMSWW